MEVGTIATDMSCVCVLRMPLCSVKVSSESEASSKKEPLLGYGGEATVLWVCTVSVLCKCV